MMITCGNLVTPSSFPFCRVIGLKGVSHRISTRHETFTERVTSEPMKHFFNRNRLLMASCCSLMIKVNFFPLLEKLNSKTSWDESPAIIGSPDHLCVPVPLLVGSGIAHSFHFVSLQVSLTTFYAATKNAEWWNWVACHLHSIHGSCPCSLPSMHRREKKRQQALDWWHRTLIQLHGANLQRLTLSNCLFCDKRGLKFLVNNAPLLPRLSKIVNTSAESHHGLTLSLQNLLFLRGSKQRLQVREGLPNTGRSHVYWEKECSWRSLAFHLSAVNQSDFSRKFEEIKAIACRIFNVIPDVCTLVMQQKAREKIVGQNAAKLCLLSLFVRSSHGSDCPWNEKTSFSSCFRNLAMHLHSRVFVWLSDRSPSARRFHRNRSLA